MGKASRKKKIGEVGAAATGDRRPATETRTLVAVAAVLALLVFAIFGQVVTHQFINWDDPVYATDNATVQHGLSVDGIRYAFTSNQPYYWQPLTWLSLELDSTLLGSRPAVHLGVNVIMHAAAVVLLFLLLQQATGATWLAAFAAAIWGVHPLRIESVAWVAERKDVLSTMLFLAAILAYVRGRRVLVYVLYILALMSKPMVITLPLVLFLVDIWPLRRRPTIKDKIPLAVLAVAVAAITLVGQQGAISAHLPLSLRLSNAIVSYVAYLGKIFVPARLSILYPYTFQIPAWKVAGCATILIAITSAVVYSRRQHLIVGWAWYVCTLVPVIGIVQSGPQSMADRFTYIPAIGIIVALVWSVRIVALGVAALVACCVVTLFNLPYWNDSVTLFTHAVEVTNENALAYVKLGDALLANNRIAEANDDYAKAVAYGRGGSIPLAAQGIAFVTQRRYTEAIAPLERALTLNPDMDAARENYGDALMNAGRPVEAIAQFEAALRSDKRNRRAELLQALGDAKRFAGRTDEGIADLRESIGLKSTAGTWNDLGSAYSAKGDMPAAEQAFTQAIAIDPNSYDARMNYAAVLSRTNRSDDAAAQIREAMRIDPKNVEPRVYLAIVNAASGNKAQAAALASEAQQMDANAANDFFTRALHLSPDAANLQHFIQKMRL